MIRRWLQSDLVGTLVLNAIGVALGLIILVAWFQLGVLRSIDILFYRGVVLSGLTMLLTGLAVHAIARPIRGARVAEAVSIACLSFGINLSVLVVAPVTVDRSISVFLLGAMALEPERSWTSAELQAVFESTYLGHYKQIERRMIEQSITGNVAPHENGFRISERGLAFIRTAKLTARLFDTDRRMVAPQRGEAVAGESAARSR